MKRILYAFVLCVTALTTQAQVTSISSIRVGATILAGTALVVEQNNYGAPEMEFGWMPAISAGILANINWYDAFGLQIEGNYASQGQVYYATQSGQYVRKDVRLSYVQVPILFRYTFTDYSMNQNAPDLFFVAGPQFSGLQSASVSYKRSNQEVDFVTYHNTVINPLRDRHPTYTSDLDLFNNFDLSLVVGLGAEFPLSDYISLIVESRLTLGVSDINARAWRFPDLRNNYTASHNYTWGLKIGVVGTIW